MKLYYSQGQINETLFSLYLYLYTFLIENYLVFSREQ